MGLQRDMSLCPAEKFLTFLETYSTMPVIDLE